MVRKDGATTRQERQQFLAQAVMAGTDDGGTLMLKPSVAEWGYKTGLSEVRVVEYLEQLAKFLPIKLDYENDTITRKPTE